MRAGEPIDGAWLDEANDLIRLGSEKLTDVDPEHYDAIIEARERFFAKLLGWAERSHPLHSTYGELRQNDRICRLSTAIGAFRLMYETGHDPVDTTLLAGSSILKLKPGAMLKRLGSLSTGFN